MGFGPFDHDSFHQAKRSTPDSRTPCYPVDAIPSKFSVVFPYASFNELQSSCLFDIWYSRKSLVIAAPTGSGKTGVLELAICRAWEDFGDKMFALYMAPTKGLVREKFTDWKGKFSQLGIRIEELSGDSQFNPKQTQTHIHLICTTPEKWDTQCRSGQKRAFLYLIDEVHVIGEPDRGPTLEAVLTRTLVRSRNSKIPTRFVALSATIANPEHIGKWLGRNVEYKVRNIDASTKPCPVNVVVKGFPCPFDKSNYCFDISLDFKLPGIIMEYAPSGKSTLIFVSTRNAAASCAKRLAKTQSWFTVKTLDKALMELRTKLSDPKLPELVQNGVAFHHAGLSLKDRALIEEAFVSGVLRVLVATSTLALGVNLPAYLVIVRGTTMYNGGTTTEYSSSRIHQMIGRAGRIQFETSGQAVIMTKDATQSRYEAMLTGELESVESFLQHDLMKHLNAEITLGNCKSQSDCIEWLKSTFLYVRAEARSMLAGKQAEFKVFVEGVLMMSGCQAADRMKRILCATLRRNQLTFLPTSFSELGYVFNGSSLSFNGFSTLIDTLRSLDSSAKLSMHNLLWLLSSLPDFGNAQIRIGEKTVLKKLNTQLRFKVLEKPSLWTKQHKIFILLQSQLESSEITQSTALRLERMSMMKVAKHASRCLYESVLSLCQQQSNVGRRQQTDYVRITFTTVRNISLLAKSLCSEMWYDSKFCVQLLKGIGPSRASRLIQSAYDTFEKIRSADPRILEMVTQKNPPFGSRLQHQVTVKIPRYFLHWDILGETPEIVIGLENAQSLQDRSSAVMIVGDDNENVRLLKRLTHDELARKHIFKPVLDSDWSKLEVYLINETISAVDKSGIIQRKAPSANINGTQNSDLQHRLRNGNEAATCNTWLERDIERSTQQTPIDAIAHVLRARAEEISNQYAMFHSAEQPIVGKPSSDKEREMMSKNVTGVSRELATNAGIKHKDLMWKVTQDIEQPSQAKPKSTLLKRKANKVASSKASTKRPSEIQEINESNSNSTGSRDAPLRLEPLIDIPDKLLAESMREAEPAITTNVEDKEWESFLQSTNAKINQLLSD